MSRTGYVRFNSPYTSIFPLGYVYIPLDTSTFTMSTPISGTFSNFCWNFVGPRQKLWHILDFMCWLLPLPMFTYFRYCRIEPARNQHKSMGISSPADIPILHHGRLSERFINHFTMHVLPFLTDMIIDISCHCNITMS